MTSFCGGSTTAGGKCQRPAGWGTAHVGEGRCKLHGGNAGRPVEHGRYSKYAPEKLRDKIEAFKNDDPLSLIDELATQRALLADYMERFQTTGGQFPADDIYRLMSWIGDIGAMVDRMVKIRNSTALTAAEVAYLVARIPEVIAKYIDDPDKQQAFVADLFGGIAPASLSETIGASTTRGE